MELLYVFKIFRALTIIIGLRQSIELSEVVINVRVCVFINGIEKLLKCLQKIKNR